MNIDFSTATLSLLLVIGAVNVISFFNPTLDSKVKFAISIVVAFIVYFIPASLGNIILDALKAAIATAFAASGAYKLGQKVGGDR
jgi:hypothetical protein